MKKITVILIGAGNRGTIYTDIMKEMPDKFQVVGVADALQEHRADIQKKHNIPDSSIQWCVNW